MYVCIYIPFGTNRIEKRHTHNTERTHTEQLCVCVCVIVCVTVCAGVCERERKRVQVTQKDGRTDGRTDEEVEQTYNSRDRRYKQTDTGLTTD